MLEIEIEREHTQITEKISMTEVIKILGKFREWVENEKLDDSRLMLLGQLITRFYERRGDRIRNPAVADVVWVTIEELIKR